jgi:hypothetical protein
VNGLARQGLQFHLNTLQQLSEQLADPSAVIAETFATQMDTFRRQRETFRNRYIRLLKDPETQGRCLIPAAGRTLSSGPRRMTTR